MDEKIFQALEDLHHRELDRAALDFYKNRQSMTNAQMGGLWNICQGSEKISEIRSFITHQGNKAQNKGRFWEQTFWVDLSKEISRLETQCQKMFQSFSGGSGITKETENELILETIRGLIQHLCAENSFRPFRGGENETTA